MANLPTIVAYKQASQSEQLIIEQALSQDSNRTDKELAINIITQNGNLLICKDILLEQIALGSNAIENIPQNKASKLLKMLISNLDKVL